MGQILQTIGRIQAACILLILQYITYVEGHFFIFTIFFITLLFVIFSGVGKKTLQAIVSILLACSLLIPVYIAYTEGYFVLSTLFFLLFVVVAPPTILLSLFGSCHE